MIAEVKTVEELANKIRAYNPSADVEFVKRAYWFSSEVHQKQKRKEGTPFIEHPLSVASILADMKMDITTITAGILHDTVEDTETISEDIGKRFGYEVAFLVESLTKLSRIEFKSKAMEQAENFRKMLLSMAEDIRVIIIKFADRLHNMRTLGFLPPAKQQRIATETLEIYAPLANRLGIGWIRSEFEDLSFKFLMPKLYEELEKKVAKKREEYEQYITLVRGLVGERLAEQGLPGKVSGRVKHYYGIYQKMQSQMITFEQVHDVLGIRIITDTKANCYAILGLIHSLWVPVPGKFKDYIGVPKSNQYQSLHTTVIGPKGERVEFQIRTEEMDMVSEEGIAAHWRYKEKGGFTEKDQEQISWIREILQSQSELTDARDFLEAVKVEALQHEVYIFTPQGDVKVFPTDATPVDFAYSIHTEVGNKCSGAKVNGKLVPLKYKLQNGDIVEIMTSTTQEPSRDWLKFVVSPRAKSRIKQWIKTEERKSSLEVGLKLVESELRKHGLSPSLIKSDEMAEVARSYNLQSTEDLVAAVGFGKVSAHQISNRLKPEPDTTTEEPPETMPPKLEKEQKGITIKGVDHVLYHTAKCCFPLPGDNLIGFVTKGRGVAIHRRDCKNFQRLALEEARVVDVEWKPAAESTSHVKLKVDSVDRPGILATLTAAISSMEININHISAATLQDHTARLVFILEIMDRGQLQSIIQKIAQIEGVLRVTR